MLQETLQQNSPHVGDRISILWEVMGEGPAGAASSGQWYSGVVAKYNEDTGMHMIKYDDGDSGWYDLFTGNVEFELENVPPESQSQENDEMLSAEEVADISIDERLDLTATKMANALSSGTASAPENGTASAASAGPGEDEKMRKIVRKKVPKAIRMSPRKSVW